MVKRISVISVLVLLALLVSAVAAFASDAIPAPVWKGLVEDPERENYAWMDPPDSVRDAAKGMALGGPVPLNGLWYLRNGAFDDDGGSFTMPMSWDGVCGDYTTYGSFYYENFDKAGDPVDWGFAFTIDGTSGSSSDRDAYLYQEVTMPEGYYWVDVHSSIYGSVKRWAYAYMTYYAIVPKDTVMSGGTFNGDAVPEESWRELWPFSDACIENAWECPYLQRAETVYAAGGDYVFILRAELKWPGFGAYAEYVFDDVQVIKADPDFPIEKNVCDMVFCLEGFLYR